MPPAALLESLASFSRTCPLTGAAALSGNRISLRPGTSTRWPVTITTEV